MGFLFIFFSHTDFFSFNTDFFPFNTDFLPFNTDFPCHLYVQDQCGLIEMFLFGCQHLFV